jgi:hypothetical protein
MDDKIAALKRQYNNTLERNKKAEEYFQTHTIEECLNKKFKNGTALDIFNQVVIDLSNLIIKIEDIMGKI